MDSINVDELNFYCRLCLEKNKELIDIYQNDECFRNTNEEALSCKISACVSIEISLFSNEPKKICVKCLNNINAWYDFKKSCNEANNILQKYLLDIQEKNAAAVPEMKTTTDDSLLFPEISLLSCDTLLEKSISNISSIVNYFFIPEKKENKSEIQPAHDKVNDDLCQNSEKLNAQLSTFNVSNVILPPAKVDEPNSKNVEKGYHCQLCDRSFSQFSLFLSHDENIHPTEVRKYSCSVCGRLFISEDRLNMHQKLIHREKTYQCPICDKFFVSAKSLEVHRRLHSEKYKCEKCGFLSTSKLYLNQHLQKHEGLRTFFTCNICQQKFSQKSSLLRHNKLHSKNNGKCFKCSICYLLFRSHSELVSHKNVHYGPNPSEIHKCRTCNNVFSSRKTLIVHQRRHKEPKFDCTVCEKKFKSNYDLRIHMDTHSDNKTFSCFHCNKKFSFKKTLTNHIKKYYPRVRSDLIV